MPKRVDHQQRKREIVEALLRIAADHGLPAVTLRAVAAEAGISMNLVQYYFQTKDQMLAYGWQRLTELTGERAGEIVAKAMATGDARAIIRAYLVSVFPMDERGWMLGAVHIAFFAADVTNRADPADRDQLPHHLKRAVADLIRGAQQEGAVPSALDADLEADALTAMSAGLLSAILVDVYRLEQAMAIVDYRLDGLFGSDRRA